jgi:hypothetical protein
VSASFTVSSTEDAIYMAELTLGDDTLAALLVDSHVAMHCADAPPDGMLPWHDFVLDVCGEHPDRLVMASRRDTGPTFVLEDELDRWRVMHNRHCNRELELVDWLVFVRDEVVLSLAEIAGPQPDWS